MIGILFAYFCTRREKNVARLNFFCSPHHVSKSRIRDRGHYLQIDESMKKFKLDAKFDFKVTIQTFSNLSKRRDNESF